MIAQAEQDGRRAVAQLVFNLPASFRPEEVLPRELWTRADDARYLVSAVVKKTAEGNLDAWGMARLQAEILRRTMYARTATAIERALIDANVIETAPHCAGKRSKGFRLGAAYVGDRYIRRPAVDVRLIERWQKECDRMDAEQRRTVWKPIHDMLAAELPHVTITEKADDVLAALQNPAARLCQDVAVDNIRRGQHPFTVSSTGRVFNSITGLKPDLRHELRIEGRPTGCIDIVAAQPALLAALIAQNYPPNVLKKRSTYKHYQPDRSLSPSGSQPPSKSQSVSQKTIFGSSEQKRVATSRALARDAQSFIECACDGSIYDVLGRLTGLERQDVKRAFLRDVLAKKGRYDSETERAFANEFPTVWEFIRDVNHDDHATLIRLLQRAESELVVETIAPRLLSAGCRVVTLHDAIYSRADQLSAVEDGFSDTIRELGINLRTKREESTVDDANLSTIVDVAHPQQEARATSGSPKEPSRSGSNGLNFPDVGNICSPLRAAILKNDDLTDTGKLLAWMAAICKLPDAPLNDTDTDRINLLGAAERAIEKGRNPPAMLWAIVKGHKWHLITQAQERRAQERLADHRRRRSAPPQPEVLALVAHMTLQDREITVTEA